MLEADYSWKNPSMVAFRDSLSDTDRHRLDKELDSYAKELTTAMLFRSGYEELLQMVAEKEITPLLFQWALAVRDGINGKECRVED